MAGADGLPDDIVLNVERMDAQGRAIHFRARFARLVGLGVAGGVVAAIVSRGDGGLANVLQGLACALVAWIAVCVAFFASPDPHVPQGRLRVGPHALELTAEGRQDVFRWDEPFALAIERTTSTFTATRSTRTTWELSAPGRQPVRLTHRVVEEVGPGHPYDPGDREAFERAKRAWELHALGPAVLARVERVAEVMGVAVGPLR